MGQVLHGCATTTEAYDIGSVLDLGIQPLQRVVAVDLQPVRAWEVHVRKPLVLGNVHQLGRLEQGLADLVGTGPQVPSAPLIWH